MDKKITKLMEKYGFAEDVELGKIPIYSEDMTEEEKRLIEEYINGLISQIEKITNN